MSETRALVLLRHGQTSWNAVRRIQGQLDSELDEVGQAQGQAAAAVIAKHNPQHVWSSDLQRARVTGEYVAEASGLSVVTDVRLREFGFGEWEGRLHTELDVEHPERIARLRRGNFDAVPGGEPAAEVCERMSAALRELLDQTDLGRASIAVSHGGAIRAGIGALLAWPELQVSTLAPLRNCCWAVLVESAGNLQLASYNQTA